MDLFYWWARVSIDGKYGRWVPTGCLLRDDAEFYISTVYSGAYVKEWKQL